MRAGGPRHDSMDLVQYGLHYGVVCQNTDPERLDRVKVRLPWLDGGNEDQMHWAQLATPMAGSHFGWYALPDVDDVVIVMFIAGDISQPVIVGGVWSTPDFSPEPNEDGKNNFRGYRSRSGHRLIFDDSQRPKVVIADKTRKNMVGLGHFAKAGAGPNTCAVYKPALSGETGVSFSSVEGSLEVTCPSGALKIEARQNIHIHAKGTIDLKAGGNVSIKASSAATLTSSSPSHIDSSKHSIG
jgi:uncharacterized protein involved in type VI secretion and phage assembly